MPPLCRTMPYTVARPNPVPRPSSLVVKKGSNRCASTWSSMPMPVSLTESATSGPVAGRSSPGAGTPAALTLAVPMVSVPPSGMASRALTPRLAMTCSIWPGSAITKPSAGSRSSPREIRSPTTRRSMPPISCTMVLRFTSRGCMTCFRLYARSWRTSPAARCAARPISWISSRRGSAMPVSDSSSSVLPRIAVSRLLKSCAIPPASCPTASIFCACTELVLEALALGHVPEVRPADKAAARRRRARSRR